MGNAYEILKQRKKTGSDYYNPETNTYRSGKSAADILNERRSNTYRKQLSDINIKSLYDNNSFGMSKENAQAYKDSVSTYKSTLEKLRQYDSSISDDDYNKTIASLDALSNKFDLLSQFKSREEYDKAVSDYQKSEKQKKEMLAFDVKAGKKEIDSLQKTLKEIDSLPVGKPYTDTLHSLLKQAGYSSVKELKNGINQKLQYVKSAEKAQKLNSVLNSPDFEEYAQKGANIVNPTFEEAQGNFSIGNLRFGNKDINNIVTFSRDNSNKLEERSALAVSNGSIANDVGNYLYKFMTDDEVKQYNYYLAKENEGKIKAGTASDFLAGLEPYLEARQGVNMYENNKGDWLFERTLAFNAGLDQFGSGVKNLFNTKDDYIAPSAWQSADELYYKDLEDKGIKILGKSLGQITHDAVKTTANMLPTIAISYMTGGIASGLGASAATAGKIGAIAGNVAMGASAAGNEYAEMLNSGMNKDQARSISLLKGAWEGASEYYLGGIEGLASGKMTKALFGETLEKAGTGATKALLEFFGDMASEGMEEVIQDIGSSIIEGVATGKWEFSNAEDLAYEFALGALTAGFMNTPSASASAVSNIREDFRYGQLYGDNESQTNLVKEGLDAGDNTLSKKLAEKYQKRLDKGKNLSGRQIANLVEANRNSLVAKDVATIKNEVTKYLNDLGETGDVDLIASAITKRISGLDLNTSENESIDESKYAKRVLFELNPDVISSGMYSTALSEKLNTNEINDYVYGEKGAQTLERLSQVKAEIEKEEADAQKEKNRRLAIALSVSPNGKTEIAETGKEVKIAGIDTIRKGKVILRLDDGSTVSSDKVNYANDTEADLYANIGSVTSDAEAANRIIAEYDENAGLTPTQYLAGMAQGYKYGSIGYAKNNIPAKMIFHNLTPAQQNTAYRLGEILGDTRAEAAQEAVNEKVSAGKKKGVQRKGNIIFEGSAVEEYEKIKKQSDDKAKRQMADITAVEKIVTDITHGTVHFYNTYVNKDGVRCYADNSPLFNKGEAADNGIYDSATGDIWLDLYAGEKGEGVILWKFAHELLHFGSDWSPAEYRKFAKWLVSEYGEKGANINRLVEEKMQRAKMKGRTLTEKRALEEVVARYAERMFTDTDLLSKLERLKTQDKTLWEKIKDLFERLQALIKERYAGLEPDTAEAKMFKSLGNKVDTAVDMFAKMLTEAGNAYESAEITETGNVQRGTRTDIKHSVRTTSDEIKYAVLDNDIFTDDKGNPLTPREAYRALIGQKITLEDGDTITFVKKLPGNVDMYKELFRKYPAFKGNINIKAVNEAINKNIIDTIEASTITDNDRNNPQRHIHLGVKDFDNRTVYVTDGTSVYKLTLAIANLTDGVKVAYSKGMLVPASQKVTDKIMETETAGKSPRESVSKETIPQTDTKSQEKYSDDFDGTRRSERVTDKDTLDMLNKQVKNGQVTTVYRAMQLVDGKLYPPMAGKVNGKWQNPSGLNKWEMSTEVSDFDDAVSRGMMKPYTDKNGNTYYKYKLVKGNVEGIEKGTDIWADYAPYIHTSLSPLNDQFTSAYKRPNIVIVKGYVPNSELTSKYQAEGAKKTVGETTWHSGVVAAQMPESRRVILTRYFMPVSVVKDSVVALQIRDMMKGKDIEIPYNVVTPSLRSELEKIGVKIGEGKGLANLPPKDNIRHSERDNITDTKAFKQWFGKSVTVNEDGTPKVFYHGTKNDFTVFDTSKSGENYGGYNAAGGGLDFTDTEARARLWGQKAKGTGEVKVMPVYIKAEKPFYSYHGKVDSELASELPTSLTKEQRKEATSLGATFHKVLEENGISFIAALKAHGYDSYMMYPNAENISVFSPMQVKSATDNIGAFDKNNPDIRYSDRDNTYLELAKEPDKNEAKLQSMVEEAAEEAMPNSKVREDNGKLRVVYHGRTSEFNVFDRGFANIEGDFGKGYYFSSDYYDSANNYGEEGADITNKIARAAERIESDSDGKVSYEEAKEIAKKKFVTAEENVIDCYLDIRNPVYITANEKGTFLDFTENYDEEYDEYDEPEGLLVDFIEALRNVSRDYAWRDVDFSFLYDEYGYDGGMYAADAVQVIKNRIIDELMDENGDIAVSEVIRAAFEEIGFDGIIDSSVSYKFSNMGLSRDTTHYIAFDSEQIKLADAVTYDDEGNIIPLSERFNEENKDIRFSERDNGVMPEPFTTLEDGNVQISVKDLATEDWGKVYKAMKKAGYDITSAQQAKEVYSRLATNGKYTFNDEQSEAIKEQYKVIDNKYHRNPKREAAAKKEFGTTYNYAEAGYILSDGTMLDFSEKRNGGTPGTRSQDHREIASVFDDDEIQGEYGDNTPYMNEFINEGNIRLMESQGVTIGQLEPTVAQYDRLYNFISRCLNKNGFFYLDISNNKGYTIESREYEENIKPSKIISDIKAYYKNGELPYVSELNQFRFSERNPEYAAELERKNKQLEKENAIYKEDLKDIKALLKLQSKQTHGKMITKSSVDVIAKRIAKENNIDTSAVKGLTDLLYDFYSYVKATGQNVSEVEIKERTQPIIDLLQDNKKVGKGSLSNYAQEIFNEIKGTRVYVSPELKAEMNFANDKSGYNTLRKSLMGWVTLTSDPTATPLDSLWQEWAEMFPGTFNADINEKNMLSALENAIESLRATRFDYLDMVDFYADEIKQQYLTDILEGFWDTTTLYTVADKYAKEINILKSKHRQQFEQLRQMQTEKIAELEQEQNQKLEAYKKRVAESQKKLIEKYNDRIESSRERRKTTEVRGKIKRLWAKLDKMYRNPTDYSYIPKDLRDAALDVLTALDIRTGKTNKTQEALTKLYDAYQRLNNSKDEDLKAAYDEQLSSALFRIKDILAGRNIYDQRISASMLEYIYTRLASVYGQIMDAKNLIGENEKMTIRESGNRIIDEQNDIYENRSDSKVREILKNVDDATSFFYLNSMRAILKMSGYKENSELNRLFVALNEGLKRKYDFKMMTAKKLDALVKTKEGQKAFESAVNDIVDFGWAKMTKMQAAQLMLTLERESDIGTKHIATGGATITNPKYHDNFEKRRENATTVKYDTLQMMSDIQDVISKDKWMQDYIEVAKDILRVDTKRAINSASQILKHRDIAADDYYIPFVTNDSFTVREIEGLVHDATIEGKGPFKNTTAGASNALYIEGLDIALERSINIASDYYGLAVPIRNINRALNVKNDESGRSVRDSIKKNWKSRGVKLIEQTLTDIQTNRKNDNLAILDALKSAFITSTLNGNISVAIKQAASLDTAFAVLNWRSAPVAWKEFIKTVANYDAITAEIDEHTSEHWRRRIGLSTDEIASMKENSGFFGKVNKNLPTAINGAKWIQMIDCWTTATFWNMAKQDIDKAISNGELDIKSGSDEYWNEVTKLYEKTIETTQPMYDALHRSEMQKNAVANKIFMFKTQPLQNAGLLYEAAHGYMTARATGDTELAQKYKRQLGKVVYTQTRSALTFALMTMIASAIKGKMKRYKDEDEDLTLASVIKRLLADMGGTGSGLILPIAGTEIYNYLESVISGNSFSKSLLSYPTVDWINEYASSITGVFSSPSAKSIARLLMKFGDLTGQPATNYYNLIHGIGYNTTDIIKGDILEYEASEDQTTSHLLNRAHGAYKSGNTAEVKEYVQEAINNKVAEGKTEKEAKSALRSSLTSKYKPLYLAAYDSGDEETLRDIRQFLTATGVYGSGLDVVDTVQNWIRSKK